MVTGTKRKPVERHECGCGAMIAKTGQLMHEASKAHRAWAGADAVVNAGIPPESPMDETLVAALAARDAGKDPRDVAKMVRSVWTRMEWPDAVHTGTQKDFFDDHGIPVITLPRHVDPTEASRYVLDWMGVLKASGWGQPEWSIRTFEVNWGAFLAAQEAEIKRLREIAGA